MIERQGDIWDTDAGGIGHGVNCRGAMGAGIAVQFRQTYPDMYMEYAEQCRLGLLQGGDVMVYEDPNADRFVYNIASQYELGKNAKYTYLLEGLLSAAQHADEVGVETIAIPWIGCGIGGLDYDDLVSAVKTAEDLYLVEFEVWKYKP